ncbi:hypothetical protein EML15_04170 [Corynebacterium sp. sy017]|uniref:plasmid pRiA4b ORF-3 family protein n=1 Tax=unclassified Corynebacterium TaxID=2624378 RepID=UPI0011871B6D|nr:MULTISPECIES: plasmid pRiA4b ORF-3 family protein [unclassified Corynebacterium]MBP3088343.1 hypothetical protein [Corynebacterium sp. sy017]QDZ41795.1 plasmid pRiA4b ORF-3 family protein [Corynebacterium sp. sy039]TSD91662.1 hypothetical protein ELY17_04170 [Corynebacterium sp. SY003]
MTSYPDVAQIIDLTTFRRARTTPAQAHTAIICATLSTAQADMYRSVGVNDAMSLEQLHNVINICFGIEQKNTPWKFCDQDDRVLSREKSVHDVLGQQQSRIDYYWGLWRIGIEYVDSFARDRGTPQALCIGGSGALEVTNGDFDPSVINAKLTGDDVINRILSMIHPEAAQVIKRSGMYDFVPLLQAIDLHSPAPQQQIVRKDLPLECDPQARDAYWATLLGLLCLSDEKLIDAVVESLMEALGWGYASAAEIRVLCQESLSYLDELGAYGTDAVSLVDRIDIYRELLRRPSVSLW